MARKSIRKELEEIGNSKTWKMLWSDGRSLSLCSLPFFEDRNELFHITDPRLQSIGTYAVSPDNKKAAFTIYPLRKSSPIPENAELYLINTNGTNLVKIVDAPAYHLINFLGDAKLLLGGYLMNNSEHLFTFELETKGIDVLDELGPSTVGMSYATTSHAGDLLVYDSGGGFMVDGIRANSIRKINIKGDRPILSPNGQWILFRRGGMTGSYYLLSIDGLNETSILSEKKIQSLLRDSGGYRDLGFLSWSPNSKFVLLCESSDLDKGRMFVLKLETKEIVEVISHKEKGENRYRF